MAHPRLAELEIRVKDLARAYRFYESLFGWQLPHHTVDPKSAHKIATSFTDDPAAPETRLWFETSDPKGATAKVAELGGAARQNGAASDDQGVPLRFRGSSPDTPAPQDYAPRGEVGVVIVGAPDTAKARDFYGLLCGWTFHQIRQDDRWWQNDGPVGFFQSDLMNIDFAPPTEAATVERRIAFLFNVPDLDAAIEEVGRLGGRTLAPATMGIYPICGCWDDQGTRFGLCSIPS